MDGGLYEITHKHFKSENSKTPKRDGTVMEKAIWIRDEKMIFENIALKKQGSKSHKSILETTVRSVWAVKEYGTILVTKGPIIPLLNFESMEKI